jgi:oligoribonuclease
VTNKELEPLDEGVEYIVKTDQDVLDNMNEW